MSLFFGRHPGSIQTASRVGDKAFHSHSLLGTRGPHQLPPCAESACSLGFLPPNITCFVARLWTSSLLEVTFVPDASDQNGVQSRYSRLGRISNRPRGNYFLRGAHFLCISSIASRMCPSRYELSWSNIADGAGSRILLVPQETIGR